MGTSHRGSDARDRRSRIRKSLPPHIERLESRRVLSASLLAESTDQAAETQDMMGSFDAFLRDQAARQYAGLAIDAPYPARAPAGGASATIAVAPSGGAPTI